MIWQNWDDDINCMYVQQQLELNPAGTVTAIMLQPIPADALFGGCCSCCPCCSSCIFDTAVYHCCACTLLLTEFFAQNYISRSSLLYMPFCSKYRSVAITCTRVGVREHTPICSTDFFFHWLNWFIDWIVFYFIAFTSTDLRRIQTWRLSISWTYRNRAGKTAEENSREGRYVERETEHRRSKPDKIEKQNETENEKLEKTEMGRHKKMETK